MTCSKEAKSTCNAFELGSIPIHSTNIFSKICYNSGINSSCNETRKYLFEVHHKDSDRENNVKENLEIVCCNCHNKRHLKIDESGEWIYDSKSLTPRDLIDKL